MGKVNVCPIHAIEFIEECAECCEEEISKESSIEPAFCGNHDRYFVNECQDCKKELSDN